MSVADVCGTTRAQESAVGACVACVAHAKTSSITARIARSMAGTGGGCAAWANAEAIGTVETNKWAAGAGRFTVGGACIATPTLGAETKSFIANAAIIADFSCVFGTQLVAVGATPACLTDGAVSRDEVAMRDVVVAVAGSVC
jgi:hypothetical protein